YRERQRQIEKERRALARARRHLDATAERGDFGASDVHPDNTTRKLRNLRRRRESGLEDEFDELRVGRRGVGGDAPLRHRSRANLLEVDPATVVDELDRDFIAPLPHRERDLARFRLARGFARSARLDAMIE